MNIRFSPINYKVEKFSKYSASKISSCIKIMFELSNAPLYNVKTFVFSCKLTLMRKT